MNRFKERLIELNACKEAIKWVKNRTPEQAFAECNRGDWLLWWFFAEKETPGFPDIREITLVKARCAKLVIHLMKDERSVKAVEVAEQYGLGKATNEELKAASTASDAAAAAAYTASTAASTASDAAYTASTAASTASDAASDATDDAASTASDAAFAAYAASTAAYVATYAAYTATRNDTLKKCADICREIFYIPEDYCK